MSKGKGEGSSLVIAPLTILDSGAFTISEVAADWHWLSWRKRLLIARAKGLWTRSYAAIYYAPINHGRPSPRNRCT